MKAFRRTLVLTTAISIAAAAFPVAPVLAGPEFCDPSEDRSESNGCMPSPAQCATGNYEGVTQTGIPGRVAECWTYLDPVTGLRRIAYYSGGQGHPLCGTIIQENQTTMSWSDPDGCLLPPNEIDRGYGVTGNRHNASEAGAAGAIASVSPLATSLGMDVLQAGGNAIDAAAATVFGVSVTNQESCGIGGGGFLVYRSSSGETAALDFRETAPAAMTAESLPREDGSLIKEGTGHLVVGVPGTVAGMAAALERFGSRSLAEVVSPAADLADAGFPITGDVADMLKAEAPRLREYPASAQVYLDPSGEPLPPYPLSPLLVQPDLAATLRAIADGGPDTFYRGDIAEKIVLDMEASAANTDPHARGIMTAEDLASYRAIWREPLHAKYRDAHLTAMPPPAAGGVFALEMLNIVEGFDVASMRHSSADHIHAFAEAQKIAWADRNRYLADPDFEVVPTEELISKRYAEQRRRDITKIWPKAGSYDAGTFPTDAEDADGTGEGTNTAHISVVDAAGNAVAVTCSVEQAFGSAVVVPGTGVLLNNEMRDFDGPETANEPGPGKRPRSSQSPTIVVRQGRPILVVGGVGASTIPMGVALAVSNVVDFGADPAKAVDLARFSEQKCCTMIIEHARIPEDTLTQLEHRGHHLPATHRIGEYGIYAFSAMTGWLQAVGQVDSGGYVASSDPRTECGAAVLAFIAAAPIPQCP